MLYNLGFGGGIEVYQHVGAKNYIKGLHEDHFVVIVQIEFVEGDEFLHLRGKNEQAVILADIFALVKVRDIANRVGVVDPFLGLGNNGFVDIGADDLYDPVFQQRSPFFQKDHGQGVGFFPGGGGCAPYAQLTETHLVLGFNYLRQEFGLQGIQLWDIAEELGLVGGNFIHQKLQFLVATN